MKRKNFLGVLTILMMTLPAVAAWQSVGPDGGYIQALAPDPGDADRLYCATYEYPDSARLFLTTDAGASWELRGTLPEQITPYLAVDPHAPSRLYAGGRQNTVCRSTDGGSSWQVANLPGYCVAFAADPLVEGRLMAAGYYNYSGAYRAAAYVSTDTGATWQVSMPQPDTAGYAYSVAADPTAAGAFFLGAYSGKVYRTTDAGGHWQLVNTGLPTTTGVMALSVCGADGNCVLAATSNGLYRTTDAGAAWTLVGAGLINGSQNVAFSPADPSVAYAIGRSDSIRVVVSTDTGATWTRPVPGYVTNKGAELAPDAGSGAAAWVSTMSGIFRSDDYAANWTEAHTGLRISWIYCMSASPEDPERLYLEAGGDAVFRSWSGGDTWTRCNEFLSCGNICGIGVVGGTWRDVLYALEGSG
jgi:photosystem II stability/assembly factor-like uncharacterized protein